MSTSSRSRLPLEPHGAVLHPEEALARLPGPAGERYTVAFTHGSLAVELYAPRGVDPQSPHTRDEGYVVIRGSGWLVHGDRRDPIRAGDFLFVAAGVEHRFEEFTDDLALWVVFYGPEGGESTS